MSEALHISADYHEKGVTVVLRGRVNIESSPYLHDYLLAVLRGQLVPSSLVIDLANVVYMDTSGIATLIETFKIAHVNRIKMRLQGLQGRLLHLFQSTGVLSVLENNNLLAKPVP